MCLLRGLCNECVVHKSVLMLQSLALAHTEVKDDTVIFSDWKETDFRTGKDPWWA